MLNELYDGRAGVSKVMIALGYTDLRSGIDRLASIIKNNYHLNPYEKDVLFLFCGRRSDRIKGLLWEGTGFVLLYKRLEGGRFSWPRTTSELKNLSREQYSLLMMGYNPIKIKKRIKEVYPAKAV